MKKERREEINRIEKACQGPALPRHGESLEGCLKKKDIKWAETGES